jgi:hypothetical protein
MGPVKENIIMLDDATRTWVARPASTIQYAAIPVSM